MRPASNNNVNILYGLPNDGSFVDANGVGVYGGFAVDTLPSLGSGVAPAQFQRYTGIASRSIDTRNSAGVHRRMEFYFGEITKGSSAYGINTYGWVAKDALTAV